MELQSFSEHLLFVCNIPYREEVKEFFDYLHSFGEISFFSHFIQKSGSCYVCYYDSNSAQKAFDQINNISFGTNQLKVSFSWNNAFPLDKLSSSILVKYKNNDSLSINDVVNIFISYGEIKKVYLSQDKKSMKLVYFDTRSSLKAINNDLKDFVVLLIKPFDNISKLNFLEKELKNRQNLYEIENQKSNNLFFVNQKLNTRIQNLEDELKQLKAKYKKVSTLLDQNNPYRYKYMNLKRTYKSLLKTNSKNRSRTAKVDEELISSSNSMPPDFHINTTILNELKALSKVHPNARKFSNQLYEYSLSIYFYSAKCYRFNLQTFPFPSVSSLYYHFGYEMNCLKKYVCNLKYSSFLLDSFKEIFSMNNLVPCVISGDATVASGDPMYKQNTKNSHVYLYQLQSLSPDYPVLPIHLKMNASPNFKIENLDDMFHLRDNIEGIGLTCLAICTDGDEGTDHYHIETFEKFDQLLNAQNEVIAVPHNAHPILDLYHVLKEQRARFFRQNLALSPASPKFKTMEIQKIVDRGECFTQHNEIIRFKDEYAIDFFSPASFLDVTSNSIIINFGYFLLPFILWQTAVRYKNLTNDQRIFFFNTCFLIFKKEFDNFQGRNKNLHFYQENVSNCEVLACWTRCSLIKYMNTMILYIYALKTYGDALILLNRLTNYPIEKSFGNVREYMNNSVNQKLFRNVLVHKVLREEMNKSLDLQSNTKASNEMGGVVISPNTSQFFNFDKKKIEEEIHFLREAAYSDEYVIGINDIPNLKTLMMNLLKDPNSADTIPKNQSSTSTKQIPMRWGIPIH